MTCLNWTLVTVQVLQHHCWRKPGSWRWKSVRGKTGKTCLTYLPIIKAVKPFYIHNLHYKYMYGTPIFWWTVCDSGEYRVTRCGDCGDILSPVNFKHATCCFFIFFYRTTSPQRYSSKLQQGIMTEKTPLLDGQTPSTSAGSKVWCNVPSRSWF